MCGIVGYWSHRDLSHEKVIKKMASTLAYRGPDDSGSWHDSSCGLALGHRRLAIVDLSPLGHQPMKDSTGRFVISFNGEIYNFPQIRRELQEMGVSFRSSTDTEVILASVLKWGLEAAIQRFIGMFAFALWDNRDRTLYLVRDRLGIKPLYYGWINGSLVFASELKAIMAFPGFDASINRKALALYMRYNYVPTPYSIYNNVFKLEPGHFAKITAPEESQFKSTEYWSATSVAASGLENPISVSEDEAIQQLEALTSEAIKCRMIADVPLGAFLSGGIDSSTVVALM